MILVTAMSAIIKEMMTEKEIADKNAYVNAIETDLGEAKDIQDQTDIINNENEILMQGLKKREENKKITKYGNAISLSLVAVIFVLSMKRG